MMAKVIIPEKTEYKCDICEKTIDQREIDIQGSVNCIGRDHHGIPVGGNTIAFDVCRSCEPKIKSILNIN